MQQFIKPTNILQKLKHKREVMLKQTKNILPK